MYFFYILFFLLKIIFFNLKIINNNNNNFKNVSKNRIKFDSQTYSQLITVLLGFWLLITSIFGAFLVS